MDDKLLISSSFQAEAITDTTPTANIWNCWVRGSNIETGETRYTKNKTDTNVLTPWLTVTLLRFWRRWMSYNHRKKEGWTVLVTSCVGTAFLYTLLTEIQNKLQEDEEEGVKTYWITLGKKRGYCKLKKAAQDRTVENSLRERTCTCQGRPPTERECLSNTHNGSQSLSRK